jgi:hypothetical protein
MIAKPRRALVRAQHAARRLHEAIWALKPRDQAALPLLAKLAIWPTWSAAWILARALKRYDIPTLASVGDYRRDDAIDESRDVGRETAEAAEEPTA